MGIGLDIHFETRAKGFIGKKLKLQEGKEYFDSKTKKAIPEEVVRGQHFKIVKYTTSLFKKKFIAQVEWKHEMYTVELDYEYVEYKLGK